MKTYHIIYETTNLINGKKYIGVHSTDDIDDGYLGSGTVLCRAVIKHGRENFSRKILSRHLTREEAILEESKIVTKEIAKDPKFYNLATGGAYCEFTDERKAKISSGMIGMIKPPLSDSHKLRLSESVKKRILAGKFIPPTLQKPTSQKTKDKISLANKGKRLGCRHSEESIKKISEASKRPRKKGRIAWNRGLLGHPMPKRGPMSEELKAKISATKKLLFQNRLDSL